MSEKQPKPSTEWQNVNNNLVEDVEIAHDLALKQNEFHDAAVLYEQVAKEATDAGEPFAANNWESAAHYGMRVDGPAVVDALEGALVAKKDLEEAKANLDDAVEAHDKSLVTAMELRPRLDRPELDYGTGQNAEVDEIRVRRHRTSNDERAAQQAYAKALAVASAQDEKLNSDLIQEKVTALESNVKTAKENLDAVNESKAA